MVNVANRQFDNLSRLRPWNIGHLDDLCRNVARRGSRSNLRLDLGLKLLCEVKAIAEQHEQYDAYVIVPILADTQGFGDLMQLLDLTVDFGRADPHAARIQGRIRSSMDDNSAVLANIKCGLGDLVNSRAFITV